MTGMGLQNANAADPALGLHGRVTWLSATKIRVEYDWSDDTQLLDWIPTHGSNLVRGDKVLTIQGGSAAVRSMVWKQLMKCTRIYARDAVAINSPEAHLNFITNVLGWNGYNFNPADIIGLISVSYGNYWLEDGSTLQFPAPPIVLGEQYSVEVNISDSAISAKSTSDNTVYSHDLTIPPENARQVALGGWEGDTRWGMLTIEGEVDTTLQIPSDVIDIQTFGSTFNPVIEVSGNPVVEWTFNDGTTSPSVTPSKNYGTRGFRHNFLKVTPWSALTVINIGYDASDGGYGNFALIPEQQIMNVENLQLARSSLQAFCASYSLIPELDFRGFTAIRFLELPLNRNLKKVRLGSHPALERICVEESNLDSLDISGCSTLKDLRAANNRYTLINWGSTGSVLWHLCVRSNPQLQENIPDLTRFPLLRELLIWDDNQTGSFQCHSNTIESIQSSDNHYTSADLTGCSGLSVLDLSGSRLAALMIGSGESLTDLRLLNCGLSQVQVDLVLNTLDASGKLNGFLYLEGNAYPSLSGLDRVNSLKSKGWTINLSLPVNSITINSEAGRNIINTDKGRLQLTAEIKPDNATNKNLVWSIGEGTGLALVDSTGLVTAIENGTVTIRAESQDGTGIYAEFQITISNQVIPIREYEEGIGKILVSTEVIRILLDFDFTSWQAKLYSLTGHLISQKLVNSNEVIFNMVGASPGIYILVFENGESVRATKVLKP
jgi:hypothetical protein